MTTTVVFYATDTMADWEYGYLLAGLTMATEQAPDSLRVLIASETGAPVTSMGGLRVTPDVSLTDLDPTDIAALVLPGSDTWFSGHEKVLALADQTLTTGGVVAAICGATYGAARAGLLDDRDHTSNAADFLADAPGYDGADRYREARAVHDRGLITAPATAPVDFARAVFEALEVFPEPVVEAWYGLYTTGERRFYDALVGA
ncbi:MAG TPA: DJ-1/PfpI family protein [Microlunatus sp.]